MKIHNILTWIHVLSFNDFIQNTFFFTTVLAKSYLFPKADLSLNTTRLTDGIVMDLQLVIALDLVLPGTLNAFGWIL